MNNQTSPKDFFLHLGATIVLFSAAVAFMNLGFSIINYAFPDILANNYYARNLVWPISMTIVLVPLLYVLEWVILRDIRAFPEKISIWIRRWRVYLTLFLAGATIIGDLIVLINTYLNGEITSRFVYKILIVFVSAGIIFAYYLLNRVSINHKWSRILSITGIVLALAGIVGGFAIVGSPRTQREIRFDQQRINDLQNIQWQVVSYWQTKGKLPSRLDELKDSISYSKIPSDPESGLPYEYTASTSTSFSLCATFNRPTEDTKGRGTYDRGSIANQYASPADPNIENWTHQKGRTCFERKIDPERYPVRPAKPL